jgi:hypothetical protein
MRGCVFRGPTLDARETDRFAGLTVLPPAAAGDVYRAALAGYRTLLLIDGYFHSVPSVQHKDFLYAFDQGLQVYVCSSMGALRAAELVDFGMVGIGAVFRQYRDGVLTDEVAVAHGDADSEMGTGAW